MTEEFAPPSARAAFAGVAAFYNTELAPLMIAAEKKRQRAMALAGAIVVVAAIASGAFLVIVGDMSQIAALIAAMIGVGAAGGVLAKTSGEVTHQVLNRIAAHLGFGYLRETSRPDYCAPFIAFGLLPDFNREDWEDEIDGAHEGVGFRLVEGHLKKRSSGKKQRTRTVFHGQLLVIDYPHKFTGQTIIKRDTGVFNAMAKPGKDFQRIGLASPRFEKAYEAWSTDQVVARTLLDPVMLERFQELDRLFDGAKLRAAFSDGRLYVALETGDKLTMGAMWRAIDGPKRAAAIFKEFDLIFDLIDVAAAQVEGRLAGAFSVDDVRKKA